MRERSGREPSPKDARTASPFGLGSRGVGPGPPGPVVPFPAEPLRPPGMRNGDPTDPEGSRRDLLEE